MILLDTDRLTLLRYTAGSRCQRIAPPGSLVVHESASGGWYRESGGDALGCLCLWGAVHLTNLVEWGWAIICGAFWPLEEERGRKFLSRQWLRGFIRWPTGRFNLATCGNPFADARGVLRVM
jgi:hypothetical protein